MKVFSAALVHETSSFSPIPTAAASFAQGLWFDPGTGGAEPLGCPELGLRAAALARGHEVVDSLYTAAAPSAPARAEVHAILSERILGDLQRALPVDAVLLFLHGARAAQGCVDCEGDLLRRVRAVVGPGVPIGVELDLHGHVSSAMCDAAEVLAMCLEYPHTDFAARARHLVELVERCVSGTARPTHAFVPVPLLGFFHTTRQPMRGFVDRAAAAQGRDGILSISIQHGFGCSDTPHSGAGILVTTDADPDRARALAETLAAELFALREQIQAPAPGVDEALDAALAHTGTPVIIADTSDNPGGGAAGDATHLLGRILERGIAPAAVGALWDPPALELARRAGVGATLPLRIGGKLGPLSGPPLDLVVTVTAVRENIDGSAFGGRARFGPHVALRSAGVDIVLCAEREQIHCPQQFTALGIDLAAQRIVVVKSAQHFQAEFAPLAAGIIHAMPPGSVSADFSQWHYRHLRRPIWPLDPPPFVRDGRHWS